MRIEGDVDAEVDAAVGRVYRRVGVRERDYRRIRLCRYQTTAHLHLDELIEVKAGEGPGVKVQVTGF